MAPVTTRSMAKEDGNYVFERFTPKKRPRTSLRSALKEEKRQRQQEAREQQYGAKREVTYTEEELLAHFGADHLAGVRGCQRTLDTTSERLLALASDAEQFLEEELTEKVRGDVEAFCGKARLLVRSKLQKQYQKMITDALCPTYTPPTKVSDLTGFWEMVELQIDETQSSHDALLKLRKNNWVEEEKVKPAVAKVLKPKITSNKPAISKATTAKNMELAKARAEKMKLFKEQMKAKKAAQERENLVPMETQ